MTKKQAKAAHAAEKVSTAKSRKPTAAAPAQADVDTKRQRFEVAFPTPSNPGPASKIDMVITLLSASIEGWHAKDEVPGTEKSRRGLHLQCRRLQHHPYPEADGRMSAHEKGGASGHRPKRA